MEIGELQKLSFSDFPGKISCTVFLSGCNFRCPWCYSAEFVLPEKIKNQEKISQEYFFDFLKEKKGFLEGVCISGGEPTIHPELPIFIKKIKKLGFLVKLDTNGFNPKILQDLIDKKLIDYVALDIKAPKEKYLKVLGILNQGLRGNFFREKIFSNIEKSISILKEGKVDYEFRTTLIPKTLKKKDILEIVRWLKGGKRYTLQNFRAGRAIKPRFKKIKPYSDEYLLEIQKIILPFFEFSRIKP
ncbi:anaerobic ribonucleoside-triphosphate reductase activating protein [Parcubacteria bacterium DG_74_2]|nr:MAG: anaerobic ribonucleoside-triphosphate reductase activating protein [Parcubacteria bacterium DG_74_2]